jgi:hypothetical protein
VKTLDRNIRLEPLTHTSDAWLAINTTDLPPEQANPCTLHETLCRIAGQNTSRDAVLFLYHQKPACGLPRSSDQEGWIAATGICRCGDTSPLCTFLRIHECSGEIDPEWPVILKLCAAVGHMGGYKSDCSK